ncbi:YidH family protein [Sphingobacterium faecale]|uniref:DUF202 domain-containing protein n=1 Tax=Sphingobacterium faecale TaxID=2803775 RepID=A0ABS1R551_9SPHI|nr:DUF202 domain-containing protein [Sphingobacterium faecale]MBL1408971.1 DUF202 domain-containing protein [Sphingobacterium faecale]
MTNTDSSKKVNDHLANERTFLSWIRTSLGIMGFGFVVVKFSLFMRQITAMLSPQTSEPESHGYSSEVGTAIVIIGAVTALLAYLKYRKIGKQIEEGEFVPISSIISVIAILIAVIGFILSWYLVDSF